MPYFNTLLQEKGFDSCPLPLWKLRISKDEVNKLVVGINSYLEKYDINEDSIDAAKEIAKSIGPDVCAVFAYWWHHSYNSGKINYDTILRDMGIGVERRKIIERSIRLYFEEFNKLHIPLYRTKVKRQFLQSIAVQGGFPHSLNSLLTQNGFLNYLNHLIDIFIDVNTDHMDIIRAQELIPLYITSSAFVNNDAFPEACLEIVKEYCRLKNSESTYPEEFLGLFNNLDKIRVGSRVKKIKNFKVDWLLQFVDKSIALRYIIDCPSILPCSEFGGENSCYILNFYVDRQKIATYVKNNDEYRLDWHHTDSRIIKNTISTLKLLYTTDDCQPKEYQLSLSNIPTLEIPGKYQNVGRDLWHSSTDRNATYDKLLIPENWTCNLQLDESTYSFENKTIRTAMVYWDQITCDKIVFTNTLDNETLTFDRDAVSYQIDFSYNKPAYITESDIPISLSEFDIAHRIHIYSNDDLPLLSNNQLKISYRKPNGNISNYLRGKELPQGRIIMNITTPDGNMKRFSYFNLKDFSLSIINKSIIQVNWKYGTFALLNNQEQDVKQVNNQIIVCSHNSTNAFCDIKARLITNDGEFINVSIESPFNSSCFTGENDIIIPDNQVITLDDLFTCKLHVDGNRKLDLSLIYSDMNEERALLHKTIELRSGDYPLDYFKTEIDQYLSMFGYNDYKQYVELSISPTNKIRIKYNRYMAQQEGEGDEALIYVYDSQHNPVPDLKLLAVATDAPEDSVYYQLEVPLKKNEDRAGYYSLKRCGQSASHFIVFSGDSHYRVNPILLNFDKEKDEDERKTDASARINRISNLLLNSDEKAWNEVWHHFDLAVQYSLYFNTFDCFKAISASPHLQVQFAYRFTDAFFVQEQKYHEILLKNELRRIQEQMAFGFHYIPRWIWGETVMKIMQENAYDISKTLEILFEKFRFIKLLFEDRFGVERGVSIYNFIILDNQLEKSILGNRNYYRERINNSILFDSLQYQRIPFEIFKDLNYFNLEYKRCTTIELMSFYSLVLPQIAAKLVLCEDGQYDIWTYNEINLYTRRMINYFSNNATEVYNDIFYTTLSNKKNI